MSIYKENPIIGILSQESYLVQKAYPDADSFIVGSFVKYLEAGGARVIPIWKGQNEDYYKRVVNYTNGVLFPAGGTYFNETKGYAEAAKQIYDLAVQANKQGIYYPLMGICLGNQVLAYAAMGGNDIRVECSAKDISLPLNFTDDYTSSRLFASSNDTIINMNNIIRALKEQNITYNYHGYCLKTDMFINNKQLQDWKILSTSDDSNGLNFVSSMEHKELPFYGIQFHPEKTAYEFHKKTTVPRGIIPTEIGQYFANFFVNETRKNNNTFPTEQLEIQSLIDNYQPTFSATNTSYQQLYLFKPEDYKNNLL